MVRYSANVSEVAYSFYYRRHRDILARHIGEQGVKTLVSSQHIAHLVTQLAISASDEYVCYLH